MEQIAEAGIAGGAAGVRAAVTGVWLCAAAASAVASLPAVMWLAGCSPLGIIYLVYLLVARTTTLFVQINSLQLHSNELSSLRGYADRVDI